MTEEVESGLKEALLLLEQGIPVKARQITSGLFDYDTVCKEVSYTNRCCCFWIDIQRRLEDFTDSYEKSEQILIEWKELKQYINKGDFAYEPAKYAIQKGYFSNALKHYQKMMSKDEKDPQHRAELYRNAGICYKKLGDYENARVCLSEANNSYPNNASVLAELADCYSLCGEDRFGKVLFREAFFINAEMIDLDFLDSELIRCLIETTAKKGYTGKVLQHWIPVYGVLCGIFNIKRELTAREVGRLNQNIFTMETEYKDPACNTSILIPSLLNSYFWLIDHYVMTKEKVTKVNEILLKIKILDSTVYESYIK